MFLGLSPGRMIELVFSAALFQRMDKRLLDHHLPLMMNTQWVDLLLSEPPVIHEPALRTEAKAGCGNSSPSRNWIHSWHLELNKYLLTGRINLKCSSLALLAHAGVLGNGSL
jgi:hypothetical protein